MKIRDEFLLNEDETQSQYILRMCMHRDDYMLTWKELTEVCNTVLQVPHSESFYRKNYQSGKFVDDITTSVENSEDTQLIHCIDCDQYPACLSDYSDDLKQQEDNLRDIYQAISRERVKLRDESAQNRAYVRRISREENVKEIAHDFATVMSGKKILPEPRRTTRAVSQKSGILMLSDWHYGMVCDNPFNKFDPDICKQRVATLLDKVKNHVTTQKLDEVVVMNLSDLIAGRIHTQIRIESRFDVITQTMQVAEILAEFLSELTLLTKVRYGDVLDNHSRLEPSKSDSLDLESLVRIIPWYLKERLGTNKNFEFIENEFGMDILTCNVQGHDVIGVHGDNDRPATALDKLTLMTHRHYDLLCTAHLHHFNADEKNQSLVISNSSLMGVDSYAEKLRLTSDPSQTFIIVTPDNVAEAIYRIILK